MRMAFFLTMKSRVSSYQPRLTLKAKAKTRWSPAAQLEKLAPLLALQIPTAITTQTVTTNTS